MKRFFKALIFIIALFIPTYIAIYMYSSVSEAPVKTNSVYAMDLLSPDGTVYSFNTSDNTENEFIGMFLNINNTAKSVTSLPDDLKSAQKYTVTYYSYDLKTKYYYYFSKTKPSNSYLVDHIGNVSRIDAQSTIAFLDSKYSEYLYSDATSTPSLSLEGFEVLPTEFKWQYYTYSSNAYEVKTEMATDTQVYELSFLKGALTFNKIPESSHISITTFDGTTVFDGNLNLYNESKPLESNIRQDTLLNVTVSANWTGTISSGYEGNARYSFSIDCKYDPPSQFWLGESFIEEGEFVVISGMNVEDVSAITFSSSPEIFYNPVFYQDGDIVRALVPIKMDLGLAYQTVVFTLGYDGATTTLELLVKETSLSCSTKKNKTDSSIRTNENLSEFTSFVTLAESSSSPYFDGHFIFNDRGAPQLRFGDIVNGGPDSNGYISNGLAYYAYINGKVYSVNSGKVVAVGETAYGSNTVVIDHGLGLRSVYYCISTVYVTEGDIVERGEEIGKGASKSGFTTDSVVCIELWVNDVPVSYAPLLEGGRTSRVVFNDKTKE